MIKVKDFIIIILIIIGVYIIRGIIGLELAIICGLGGIGSYVLRNYIEPQHLVIVFILGLGIYFGMMIGNGKFWVLSVIIVGIYWGVFFKKPELILLAVSILLTDMFTLIPPDFLRIKGLFKLRDLIFVLTLIPILWKRLMDREKSKFILSSITSQGIIIFCIIIFLFIILTVIRYSYSLNLSFRMGRDYFYFFFFFIVVECVQKKEKLDFVIKSAISLSLLLAVLFIVQSLSGGKLHIFRTFSLSIQSRIWDIPIARSYAPLGYAWGICFALIGLIPYIKSKRKKLLSAIGGSIILGAIFFTFARTLWYKAIIILLLILLILPNKKKKDFLIWTLGVLGTFGIILLLIGHLRYGGKEILLRGLRVRALSGVTDIAQRKGTFGYRVETLMKYYESVIKKNLWFGKGFLHPSGKLTQVIPFHTVVWGDSAFVSILNTMGISGLILYLLLYIIFVIRGIFILKYTQNPVYKGLIIGFIASLIGDWIGIFTTRDMIIYYEITVKAFYMGIIEGIYRVTKESEITVPLGNQISKIKN